MNKNNKIIKVLNWFKIKTKKHKLKVSNNNKFNSILNNLSNIFSNHHMKKK
jgi:hypothetical protein